MTNEGARLAVIGGGPGGYAAAFLAADMGMQVTLIDEQPNPGGVCLYHGCIPSKALLHVAALIEEAKLAEDWGVRFGAPQLDLERLRGFKQGVVDRLTGGLGQLSSQHQVRYLQGRARFNDARSLSVTPAAGGAAEAVAFDHASRRHGLRVDQDPRARHRLAARPSTPRPRSSWSACRRRCSSSAGATSGSSWAASTPLSARASASSR